MSAQPSNPVVPPPAPLLLRTLQGLLRLAGWVAFSVLLLFTLYLCAGRLLLPLVAGETAVVESQLAQMLGVPVRVTALQGRWQDFTPHLEVGTLELAAPDGTTQRIDDVNFSIDVWRSAMRGTLVIRALTIQAVDLVVEQTASGAWTLVGMPPGQSDYSQQILRLLLQTPYLNLREASIAVRPRTGQPVALHSVFAQVRNSGDSHRVQLQFRLDEQAAPSRLLLELEGMPDTGLAGRGWLDLPSIQLQALLQPALDANWQLDSAQLSATAWFDFNAEGHYAFSGSLRDTTLSAQHRSQPQRVALSSGAFDFNAERAASGAWQLDLSQIALDWDQRPWDFPALSLSRPDGATPRVQLSVEQVDLAMLSSLALDALPLPAAGSSALRTLQPEGLLQHMTLDTALDGSYPGLFRLRANLVDGAVQAWNAAPAGSGLQAWLEVSADSGVAEVDADDLTLHLPDIFADSWSYGHVNGRVQWQVADGDVRVWSELLDVTGPDLEGRVGFDVRNRRDADGIHDTAFKLLVGVQRMAVLPGKVYLPSLEHIATTMDWLDAALQAGELHDSAFMFRTNSRAGVELSSTAQSWYQAEDARLQFLPEWPALEQTSARVAVRDERVDVLGRTGSIAGMALSEVFASVRGDSSGAWLHITGSSATDTATGHRFLLESPLHAALGTTFDAWQPQGQLHTRLELGIPLAGNQRPRVIDTQVVSSDSSLQIPDYALEFSAVNGEVRYTEQDGLQATALTGVLFGEPISASIDSRLTDEGNRLTLVQGTGHATAEALRTWTGQPVFVSRLLSQAQGGLDYELQLEFPGLTRADGTGVRLRLASSLEGLDLELPAPFAKRAEESRALELDYAFNTARTGDILTLRFDDLLSGQLVLDSRGLNRGQLYFGERNRSFNVRQVDSSSSGLLVSGDLDRFDYDAWAAVAQTLVSDDSDARTLKQSLRLVDINVGEFLVRGRTFDHINLQVQPQPDAWLIQARNDLLSGSLRLSEAALQPWQVKLDYLRFPPRPERSAEEARAAEAIDLLEAVDPRALPAFDFSTAELSIGESQLGSLAFTLRPTGFGAEIRDFQLLADQDAIVGLDGAEGANIDWEYRNGFHSSRFTGHFTAGNLARVLPDWGHAAFLDSNKASIAGSLGWPGSPLAFSLKHSSGEISLRIERGRFVDIDSGSSRLLGAFNFDALVRRLQLDFSDLFERGFVYDLITGDLVFQSGLITTDSLIIDGPSSRLRIDGEISLPDETIAADMLVRMPLSQNISMLAGLLGAWPIALSTYVAGKIFAEQVGEFTTLVYRLEGPWNNVEAGFDAPTPAEESTAETTIPAPQ